MRITHADDRVRADGGSADPLKNLALAVALKRAKEQDVPKENIEKAIAKVCSIHGTRVSSIHRP